MSARRAVGASRPMSVRRIGIVIAIACGALAPVSATAENLLTLGGGPFIPDNGVSEAGVGLGFAVPTQSWICFQMRLDVSRARGHDYGVLTFGPQIGTARGMIRPYFNAGVGFSAGEVDFSGLVSSWGAGATCDLSERIGVFVDAHSLTSTNMEYDAHYKQIRAGFSLRSAQRK
jgi:hypothetical protein